MGPKRAQEEGMIMTMPRRNALDTVSSFASAQEEFEAAWRNPNYTQFELPALDVNKVLNERYSVNPSTRLTRSMVWDMEMKKAWDPSTYIPYVVSSGHSWGRHNLEDGCERFFRSSMQIAWISQERGQALEEVFINRIDHKIFFLGRPEMTTDEGERIYADDYQPLFHVEHAAGGSESEPLNVWRIVFLTKNSDQRFTEPFRQMMKAGLLPGFLEIYIELDLHATLSPR
jgi:hypothetical protein